MHRRAGWLCVAGAILLLNGCGPGRSGRPVRGETLFTLLPAAFTGIDFENRLADTEALNVFTYRNYYNGGGVGIGDFNNDGLADVYLTANQLDSRLYLNRGGFRFDDVTERAGVAGAKAWKTGVSVADVNGDGWLDLYLCNAGPGDGAARANELFVNQGAGPDGVPTFREAAAAYGVADPGYSTHAAFVDYDRDGDLDLYVVNNSPRPVSSFGLRNTRHIRDPWGGDRLYRNDPGPDGTPRFTDVSEAAGIYGSEIAFGLGVTAADVDNDGWVDFYISNDFFERDYLYLNNGDGTFREALEDRMGTISLSSMGADAADVDNDGDPDVYVTDMLPASDRRLKTTSAFEAWQLYREKLRSGYYHQFMRNTLQRNNGDGTFSEVGHLTGVAATDWSWGALLADFDSDGRKDLFVANGVYRDVTDQDFLAYLAEQIDMRAVQQGRGQRYRDLIERIPSVPLANYLFANESGDAGALAFTDRAAEWGLGQPAFSNGAAYGDLDNDGDLDLVVNNVNGPAFVYRNEADTLRGNRYLRFRLEGEGTNRFGVGAKVAVRHGGAVYYAEQIPTRGFQSSVDPVLTLGLGRIDTARTVEVTWPDGRVEVLTNVATNRLLTLRQRDAAPAGAEYEPPREPAVPVFTAVAPPGLEYVHVENAFTDFDREGLLPKLLSTEGPRLATGDVDGDGLDDVFVGGAKDSPGALYLQRPDGTFARAATNAFDADRISEDTAAAFFDADGDGDLDLYVVSGGSEYSPAAPALQDRLYLGDGRGGFRKSEGRLPAEHASGACVAPADYDGDGDTDLFVCGRLEPWRYGLDAESLLLENDGRGTFADATDRQAPGLRRTGMVTDAAWADLDGDGRPDLVLAGEWMPLTVYRNTGGALARLDAPGLEQTHGLWTRLLIDDLDGDGDPDLVAGNLGLNHPLRAGPTRPLTMHAADFDRNGVVEQIVSVYEGDRAYPITLRNDLARHLPAVAARFPTHAGYAEKTVEEVFTPEELTGAVVRRAYVLATSVVENLGDGTFRVAALPWEAQFAPVYGIVAGDFDGDGRRDLVLAGNFFGFRPDVGRIDAGRGLFLRGRGGLAFEAVPARESGVSFGGQVRDARVVATARGERLILFARNDGPLHVLRTTRAGR